MDSQNFTVSFMRKLHMPPKNAGYIYINVREDQKYLREYSIFIGNYKKYPGMFMYLQ
jgi:hypothetical protein